MHLLINDNHCPCTSANLNAEVACYPLNLCHRLLFFYILFIGIRVAAVTTTYCEYVGHNYRGTYFPAARDQRSRNAANCDRRGEDYS